MESVKVLHLGLSGWSVRSVRQSSEIARRASKFMSVTPASLSVRPKMHVCGVSVCVLGRQTEKCKSISRKIVSIASNSHTEAPKTPIFGCNKKDVIPTNPLKPRA